MMFDFSALPFFDDHTHLLDVSNREITLKEYVGPFNHGYVDSLGETPFNPNGCSGNNVPLLLSDNMFEHVVKNLGVSKCFLNYMSQYFNCACDYDVVLAERNRRSMQDMKAYTKALYEDQNIIGEVVDSPLPMGDPAMECFPTKVYRLFQTDPVFYSLVKTCESYEELEAKFDATLRGALKQGFVGVKCHVLEVNRSHPHYVSAAAAESVFRAAKAGDVLSTEEVYYACFSHMMLMTQELDFPVHLHTGLTGKTNGLATNNNPLHFTTFLNDSRFLNSHLVFLHVGYPDVRAASVMAQTYPNVWIDLAQVLPWEVVNISNILEDCMGFASHGKIMLGTGAHGHPEINWISAKIAKTALAVVLEQAVDRNYMNKKQAEQTAELILYKNAQRLYKLA